MKRRASAWAAGSSIQPQKRPGFNDGLIIPGTEYPLGTPLGTVRRAAAARAPLRGAVRVIVVLVDFTDAPMATPPGHFNDLFFSTGRIPTGSVREYFTEASHGLLTLTGQVVGPYRLPRTLAAYAGGKSGTDNPEPNARTMARDAAKLANADVNFAPYDNDGNGFVDAFIVVHAGPGAEETGNANHIWSHKWVLTGSAYNADGTKIFGYLTIPEDCKIGVCAHELGHLLFGWPDLYDTDGSSEGLGNWCLMGGGSWNGNGDIPSHPSAWCKANQGWVSVVNRTTNGVVTIKDVKSGRQVYRLWKDGASGKEYFLLENRQRTLYDRKLPGEGLLIYHVDESHRRERRRKPPLHQAAGGRRPQPPARRREPGRYRRPVSRQFEECGPHQRVETEREIVRRPGHVRDGREPERDRDEHEGSTRCPLRRRITAGAEPRPAHPALELRPASSRKPRAREEGAREKTGKDSDCPDVGRGAR